MGKVIETYRGFDIILGSEAVGCKIIDTEGKVLNTKTPYYPVSAKGPKKYSTNCMGCYSSEQDTSEAITYMKEQIDREISHSLEYQRKRIATHKNSKHITYIFNNVTVNILIYGDKTNVYVNENPLRYASLPENFTLNDVLKCIHTCKIARYNITNFKDMSTNYYKNKETHKEDISILPVYELLGCPVEIDGKTVVLSNVRTSYTSEGILLEGFFLGGGSETFDLSMEQIQNLNILSLEAQGMESLPGLMKKLNFYE